MAATLRLTHKANGVEVRRGTYNIVVDGQRAGSVDMNDTIRYQSHLDVTPCKFAMAETPAVSRPSTPRTAKPSPSDAPERVSSRSSSLPSSSPSWRSNSAVQPMIALCDDIVAGQDQAGTDAVPMQVAGSANRQWTRSWTTYSRLSERYVSSLFE